jgi:RND family efflux transporter MFP subunit
LLGLVVLALIGAAGVGISREVFRSGNSEVNVLTYPVALRTISDSVIEQGALESQNTVDGRCELPGWQNKIIFIVPEGSRVKKGDVVARFDSSETQKEVDQQKVKVNEADGLVEQAQQELQVQENKNQSDIAAAELALTLAEMDVKKYQQGELTMTKADYESAIAEGQAELEKTRDDLDNIRALIKRGFRSPEQLRELELRKDSAEYRVERDKRKLELLINFESPRKITELQAQAEEAKRKLERAKTTAEAETKKAQMKVSNAKTALELQKQQLKQFEDVLKKCELAAPQDGTIAYANQPWYDQNERIREGATVRSEQSVFHIPDMTKMQVTANVHESVINKVKEGQHAVVRVDAYPDQVFDGTVETVSQLASSAYFSEAKAYQIVVRIDHIPENIRLKPGMTSEVEILVGTYENILALPTNAITEHFQTSYAYVQSGSKFERRVVETGRTTQSFVEVKSGIAAGDVVALDARQRGLADFGDKELRQQRPIQKKEQLGAGPTNGPASDPSSTPRATSDETLVPSESMPADDELDDSTDLDLPQTAPAGSGQ